MKVSELYAALSARIPAALSCSWDNDGLMCCPDPAREVRRVLIALDVTGRVIDEAERGNYDVILSHHPLIFTPLRALTPNSPVGAKLIRLVQKGIAVMSFHTRLDAVEGGVNDCLAALLSLSDVTPFGNDGEEIGRVGNLKQPMPLDRFAARVKELLGADALTVADAGRAVRRVAVLGGSGSDDVAAAIAAGADTYLSGELKHNYLTDAPDMGINLVAAGHFYTEDPVCRVLRELVLQADAGIEVALTDSNSCHII